MSRTASAPSTAMATSVENMDVLAVTPSPASEPASSAEASEEIRQ